MRSVALIALGLSITGCAGTRVVERAPVDGNRIFEIYHHESGIAPHSFRTLAVPAREGRIDGAELKDAQIPGAPPLPKPDFTGHITLAAKHIEISLLERTTDGYRALQFNGVHRIHQGEAHEQVQIENQYVEPRPPAEPSSAGASEGR